MSEELTLEELAQIEHGLSHGLDPTGAVIKRDLLELVRVYRAHLSRPVVGDEQMREALYLAGVYKGMPGLCEATAKPKHRALGDVSRALLAMSEQLAAEQAKVKALQPYKDAYEAGQDMLAVESSGGTIMAAGGGQMLSDIAPGMVKFAVRVCKLVEGEV